MSSVITGHLVAALRETDKFRSGDHSLLMGEGRDEIHRQKAEATDTALGKAHAAASTEEARRTG